MDSQSRTKLNSEREDFAESSFFVGQNMRNDLEIITKSFPLEQNELHVYALGDIHVGSPEFDETSIKKKIKIIQDDPVGVFVLCGDVADFGLKNSKSNVYLQTLSPKQQQEYVYELFKPIAKKMTGCVAGNHEDRITRDVGLSPLYDLCVLWGVEEVYRENVAITKYSFGSAKSGNQQNVFIGITTHGSTRNKHKKFISCFENADFAVAGHTHTPEYSPHGRIRIERHHATARHVPYKEIVVDANLSVGGYGVKKEYEIPPPPELQYLELKTVREPNHIRTLHRVMNYHSISL